MEDFLLHEMVSMVPIETYIQNAAWPPVQSMTAGSTILQAGVCCSTPSAGASSSTILEFGRLLLGILGSLPFGNSFVVWFHPREMDYSRTLSAITVPHRKSNL